MATIINCQYCHKPRPDTAATCPYCKPTAQQKIKSGIDSAAEKVSAVASNMGTKAEHAGISWPEKTERTQQKPDEACKYPSLAFIAGIIKVVAIFPFIGGLAALFMPGTTMSIKLMTMAATAIWAALVWAGSESIQIFIDMEENQRKILSALKDPK